VVQQELPLEAQVEQALTLAAAAEARKQTESLVQAALAQSVAAAVAVEDLASVIFLAQVE
jgi:hypothetical protein